MIPADVRHLKAYGLVAAAASIWGCLGVMAKYLYAWGMTPWSLVFMRALLGFAVCGLLILVVNRSWFSVRRRDLPFLALYALVGTSAFFVLYLFTISLTAVAVSVVLLYTAPAMATLMARFVFREAITPSKLAALVLAFAGCILITGLASEHPPVSVLGVATGLGSALTYATFGIMSKHARRRYGAFTLQFYALGFGTLFLLPLLALPDLSLGPYPDQVWLMLLVVGVGPTLVARVLYVAAVKHIEASRAAIVATIEPVVGSAAAFLLLGEALSSSQLLGGCLVLGGAVLAQQSVPGTRRRGDAETRRTNKDEQGEQARLEGVL